MLLKKENRIKEQKLENYFEYNKKKSISIIRIAYIVVFFLIVFNVASGIKDIISMQDYIGLNQNYIELPKLEVEKNSNKFNLGNVKKVLKIVGMENLESFSIDENRVQVIGKSQDMKTIRELMKNKILRNSYVKKLEGGEIYTFEINTRTDE